MKKKKLIVANWKMNPASLKEAKNIVSTVKRKTAKIKKTETVFCVPSVYLSSFAGMKGKTLLGAQNVSTEEKGSFTGEISALQVRQFGTAYVIVGHSERRKMGESDEMVAKKIRQVLQNKMKVILCIGETVRDDDGSHLEFIRTQLATSLSGVTKADIGNIVIAYEPVWAIGGSAAMGVSDIHEMNLYIKKCLNGLFADYVPAGILYGGSVTVANARDIVAESMVDGLLIGRDSLDANNFAETIKQIDMIK